MKRIISVLSLVAIAGLSVDATAAQAASNVPLCFAIAQNYNNCIHAHQRPQHWGGGYGDGGYTGGGYGGYHDGYDDEAGYRHGGGYDGGYGEGNYDEGGRDYRRAVRRQRAQSQCAVWLAQMQANGCI